MRPSSDTPQPEALLAPGQGKAVEQDPETTRANNAAFSSSFSSSPLPAADQATTTPASPSAPEVRPPSAPAPSPPAEPQQRVPATTTTSSTTPHPLQAPVPLKDVATAAAATINPTDPPPLHAQTVSALTTDSVPVATTPAASGPASAAVAKQTSKMQLSDLYKSYKPSRATFSKLRHNAQPQSITTPDYDPDLLSKDKNKQKEAVKKYLASKVRNDWDFTWPPALKDTTAQGSEDAVPSTPQSDHEPSELALTTQRATEHVLGETMDEGESDSEDDDAASVYSTVSEDNVHYKPRLEWTSELSDDDTPPVSPSPFRYESPDAVGPTVRASALAKKAQRRKALRDEMEWNVGLACFEARRNAWTQAKTVRIRPKQPTSPTSQFSPFSPRRFFPRSSVPSPPTPMSPVSSNPPSRQRRSGDGSVGGSDSSEHSKEGSKTSKEFTKQSSSDTARSAASQAPLLYPVETLLPVPPPLLPAQNPMRASVTPAVYISLYEKVVVHALTPSCPVNLSDMIRACVVGWKRDGEWPPKPSAQDQSGLIVVRRKRKNTDGATGTTRRMSLGFLNRGEKGDKEEEGGTGKGIRRSLQKVLGLGGHAHSPSIGGDAKHGNEAMVG